MDADYEIIGEYQNNIDRSSNMGKLFFKWLYQYLGSIEIGDLLKLEKNANGEYVCFPVDEDTEGFDPIIIFGCDK